ncbi:MAG: biotin/lipoyl-binding protein, partial [Armatimonadota bacterium]
MKKRVWIIVGVLIGLALVGWAIFGRGQGSGDKEYRYAKVEKGELLRSSSATGTLVPLTQVDIKSKAGGEIVKLYVEEGSVVKEGDKIAEIDPRDTKASYDQAAADMDAAKARVDAAVKQTQISERNFQNSVNQAKDRLRQAQVALDKARLQSGSQPAVSRSSLDTARASLNAALEAQRQTLNVDVPQQRRDSASQLASAKANLDAATADLTRQQGLLEKGYV